MWRNPDYTDSLPQEMQRLGKLMRRGYIRPARLIRDFERVVSRSSFDNQRAKWLCERLMGCHYPDMVGKCLDLLLEKAPTCVPSAQFFSNSLINHKNFKLTPALDQRGLATSLISKNDQDGVLCEIHRQWTYPDVFFPDIFQTERNIEIFARSLLDQIGTISRDLFQKIVDTPMHENARDVFTRSMIDHASTTYGKIRLSNFLIEEKKGVGGILMHANLLDGAQLCQAFPGDRVIEKAVRESEALALELNTSAPITPMQRRTRL